MGTTKRTPGARAGSFAILGLLLAGGAAFAQAVSLTGTVSETLSLTDNFALAGSSAGTTTSSITNFALSFASRTPTSTISLFGGTDLVFRADPGGGSNVSGFNPNLRANYSTRGQTTSFSVGANYSDAPINFQTTAPGVVIPPGGSSTIPLITSTANQRNIGANTNFGYTINATNSLSGGLNYARTDFDTGAMTLFDFSTTTASLSWSHDFNSRLSGSVDGSYSLYQAEDTTGIEARTASVGVSATWAQNNDITLSSGLNISNTSQDSTLGSSSSTNLNGNIGISYQLPTGSVTASISRSISPGSSASLLQSTSLSLNGSYDINSTSRLGLSVGYTKDDNLFGASSSSLLTISPSYSMDLTSSVSASASYTLRNSKTGTSQGISLNLVKRFDLLP